MLQSNRAVKIPKELVPTPEEVWECMRRGVVTRNAHFGIDPLALRPDLVESRKQLLNANQSSGQIVFSSIVRGDSEIFKHALRF